MYLNYEGKSNGKANLVHLKSYINCTEKDGAYKQNEPSLIWISLSF
jgi:hypothetical protein